MKIEIISNSSTDIRRTVDHLKHDGLIGLPTETVYGLGARADHAQAVSKIFQLKGRPSNHPLIVHIPPAQSKNDFSWLEQLEPWARDIPHQALQLALAFWPGPLTMILNKAKGVLDEVTGGHKTVGLRCPNHPTAIKVLQLLGTGIAAPSANRYGKISPTNAQHILDEFIPVNHLFPSAFDLLILDSGPCDVGIESTIIDLSNIEHAGLRILRPGMITIQEIEERTGLVIGKAIDDPIAHSGSHLAHYAPMTPLIIQETPLDQMVFMPNEKSIWLTMMAEDFNPKIKIAIHQLPSQPKDLAKVIYGVLREVDQLAYDRIYFRSLPKDSAWDAIRDRIQRAATGSGQS